MFNLEYLLKSYLLWKYFHGYNVWYRTQSQAPKENYAAKEKRRHPIIARLIEPKVAIGTEQKKACRCKQR